MRALKPRGLRAWAAFILLTAALIALILLRLPVLDHFYAARALQSQLLQTRSEKDIFISIKEESRLAWAEWEQLSGEKSRLEALFPLEKELPFVLVELEETINSYPLHLHRMRTGEKKLYHFYGTTLIDLAVSGHPAELESFLNRLINLPHYTAYDSITWEYGADNEASVELVLELYYLIPSGIEPLIDRPDVENCPATGSNKWQQGYSGLV